MPTREEESKTTRATAGRGGLHCLLEEEEEVVVAE